MRAAARRIHDDGVDVDERADQPSRERLAFLEPSGVNGQRPAAALRRRDDLEAVGGEHARGCGVDVGEDSALDAAREEPDACAPWALRGGHGRHVSVAPPARRDLAQGTQPPRQRRMASERGEPERRAHAARIREQAEEEPPDESVPERTLELVLDSRARGLDQTVVAHARRTRGEARHAAEAAVEVLRHGRVQRDRPVETSVHEMDAPARRVHLLAPQHVRGARREAEPAVDAVRGVLADHAASTPPGRARRLSGRREAARRRSRPTRRHSSPSRRRRQRGGPLPR